jgi:two-component system chemotaxis response regulator CheB
MPHRDIVVVGASIGGVDALTALVSKLPANFPGSLFVVQHLDPAFKSNLPRLVGRESALPVVHPLHGEQIEQGKVYIAPADNHILVRPGRIHVQRGAKENGHRPSVDALFRSASRAYGNRVVGVVLTGSLDCGTAGLMSIKARGGLAIVQNPQEAKEAGMPQSALSHVQVDHVTLLRELPGLLMELANQPVIDAIEPITTPVVRQLEGDERGSPVDIVCPLCDGALTETDTGGFQLFRCHVGHAFSTESMLLEQEEQTERALWAAVRALDESSSLARRVAEKSTGNLQERFEERARTQAAQADVIRSLLLGENR